MSEHLHVWLGDPKSVDDLGELVALLSSHVTKKDGPFVFFQKHATPIESLAKGYYKYRGVKEKIIAVAKTRSIEAASAMIGLIDYGTEGWPFSAPGLIDLGSFELEDDDGLARAK
jgi:hypothetical protein